MNNSFVLSDVLIFTGDEFIEKGYIEVEEGKIVGFGSRYCTNTLDSDRRVISKGHKTS